MEEEAPVLEEGRAPPASAPSRAHNEEQGDEEEKKKDGSSLSDFQLASPSLISSFLTAFLHRFSELFPLDHGDTSMDSQPHGKRPKHVVEALWLKDVLEKCLKEIEDTGSFFFLSQVVSDHEIAAKRVPESIEHVKSLNAEMHSLRQQIQAEDLAHKEAVISWNKTLMQMKQVEKRVNNVCTDFLKKQNLTLMEEAISLATGHENDVLYMDMMLNKLRDQKIEKEKLLAELEPRYMAEMSELIAEKTRSERWKTMGIDELRKFETQSRAVTKIQKVWRGHMDRAKHSQELKKIAKKRKELRNKSKKEKKEKQGEDDKNGVKKGGGKKKGQKKK